MKSIEEIEKRIEEIINIHENLIIVDSTDLAEYNALCGQIEALEWKMLKKVRWV
jgi:hypothetical protein